MSSRSFTAVAATGLVALLAPIATAAAGPPGKWTQVTPAGSDIPSIMRVGLARTADGVLHVGWERNEGPGAAALHSAISADAKAVSAPTPIFTNPNAGVNESVALVRAADGGLRAFFAATNQFDDGMGTAVSGDGAAWTGQAPTSLAGNAAKPVYSAGGLGAAVGTNGVFYSIWGDSAPGGGGLHPGLDPTVPDVELPGGLKSDPNVGVDSQSGQVLAAWNQIDGDDVIVMPVGGAPIAIPGSVAQLQHRVGITGRSGAPGVFVAYTQGTNPFLAKPAVYRVDSGKSRRLSNQDGEDISIAAAPGGRLWVMWKDAGTIHATRSNAAATRWGRIVEVGAPKRSTTIYDLAGEASNGALDVLALVDTGTIASWHQRLLPGLTLTKSKGRDGKTVLRATDAGSPVGGVKVTVKGAGSKTTSGKGAVTFELPQGKHGADAAKQGYAGSALSFKVK